MSLFFAQILQFNDMYKLPNSQTPNLLEVGSPVARLLAFSNIMREELAEVDAIIAGIHEGRNDIDTLTDLGDWLGDIIVYAASEARRFGLPIQQILEKGIMESNFSKLGADGKPIYDERGKVMKGPGYWKPEPKIKEILQDARGEAHTSYALYLSQESL